MNTNGFGFDLTEERALSSLERGGRIPHAVIIEGENESKLLNSAKFLSAYLVCDSPKKPCGNCKQCRNAMNAEHPDIYYAKPESGRKTDIYSIKQIRDIIIPDTVIKPNDADSKVYIFEKADERLSDIQQNALLKTIEEPPENVNFIFTCKSKNRLLPTIRSRCTAVVIDSREKFDEQIVLNAEKIVGGIISAKEYDLLAALNSLTRKDDAPRILSVVSLILRDGLALIFGGSAVTDEKLAGQLCKRFTKGKIIKMIELTDNAKEKTGKNINLNLLATWLCGEYRRISWQR